MIELVLPDMTCGHCVRTVTQTVQGLDAQAQVAADVASHTVQIQTVASESAIREALAAEGYPAQGGAA